MLGNPMEMMRKVREMQAGMEKMQEELARQTATADAGGGMVSATVNGKMQLVKVRIDKSKVDPANLDLLEDVITAAVSAAQSKAMELAQQQMAKMASEAGIPPGLLS